MADEDRLEEAGAEQAPEKKGEPKVAAPLHAERLVTVRFVHEAKWCVGTFEGATTEVIAEGEERELPRETALVFVGMGAAVLTGDQELGARQHGEVATRSRRRRR
jgi:hypothetical protein